MPGFVRTFSLEEAISRGPVKVKLRRCLEIHEILRSSLVLTA